MAKLPLIRFEPFCLIAPLESTFCQAKIYAGAGALLACIDRPTPQSYKNALLTAFNTAPLQVHCRCLFANCTQNVVGNESVQGRLKEKTRKQKAPPKVRSV